MLARGQIAVENLNKMHTTKQERELVEQKAKLETLRSLQANNMISVQRHQMQ